MAKHTDKWSVWAQQGDRLKEQMQRETKGRKGNFGPDATAKAEAPPVTCPRCGATVMAKDCVRHGMLHRGIESLTS